MRKLVRKLPRQGKVHQPVMPAPEPEIEPADWTNAQIILPEPKKLISLRLDSDVLSFFQGQGRGYQTRINAVLRAYMKANKGE
jgi:uncharacterized protein (DUF4415 family)